MVLRNLQHCLRSKMQRVMNQMLWKRHPETAQILHEFQLGHQQMGYQCILQQLLKKKEEEVNQWMIAQFLEGG
ncbi:hypothetical protein CsSME_00048501 [Camellia sinensis var. sinensis]